MKVLKPQTNIYTNCIQQLNEIRNNNQTNQVKLSSIVELFANDPWIMKIIREVAYAQNVEKEELLGEYLVGVLDSTLDYDYLLSNKTFSVTIFRQTLVHQARKLKRHTQNISSSEETVLDNLSIDFNDSLVVQNINMKHHLLSKQKAIDKLTRYIQSLDTCLNIDEFCKNTQSSMLEIEHKFNEYCNDGYKIKALQIQKKPDKYRAYFILMGQEFIKLIDKYFMVTNYSNWLLKQYHKDNLNQFEKPSLYKKINNIKTYWDLDRVDKELQK